MAMRDLIPWSRPEAPMPDLFREADRSPFFRLRQEMDRLFDDMLRAPALGTAWGASWPSLEIRETESEVLVSAELPGMTDKDVEITVQDGLLSIRGERKSESEDRERGWSERYYGRFERRIALPDGVDAEHCEAHFRDGVLTVRIPRSEPASRVRRIPINDGTRH